ncbi:MAG: WXG100 family type VII secretion target [Patulibacter minatonensis]
MANRIGGGIESMDQLAGHFDSQAAELNSLVASITSQLHSADWEGGAASRFKSQWDGEFRNVFKQVEEGLRECSGEVRQRARALEAAGG